MNSFRAHCIDNVQQLLTKHNSAVAFIPGGCTSKVQPMDVSLNQPFKDCCRRPFSEFCHLQLANMSNPADRLKTAPGSKCASEYKRLRITYLGLLQQALSLEEEEREEEQQDKKKVVMLTLKTKK